MRRVISFPRPRPRHRPRRSRRGPVIPLVLTGLLLCGLAALAQAPDAVIATMIGDVEGPAERSAGRRATPLEPRATAPVRRTPAPTLRVVDGDTLHLGAEKIRLFGIDAPEIDQTCGIGPETWACGRWAAAKLAEIAGDKLDCSGTDRDRYGRLLATCTAGGQDVAEAMVGAGAAVAYVRYSDAYSAVEAFARAKEAGIWGGPMQLPEEFRASPPKLAVAADDAGTCRIKGNISNNGRIYHRPGQEHYDETRISGQGEAWFCSAAEAEAAGFRAARR